MEKEEIIKKTWETPEIVDLDLEKTGKVANISEAGTSDGVHGTTS